MFSLKKVLIPLFYILFTMLSIFGEDARLAVMDFKADGVEESVARQVTELIRTEIISTSDYVVIERKHIDLILKEQGMQVLDTSDEKSAVRIGRLLSAQKILIGSVMKFGKSFIVNGRIVDVEKGIAEYGCRQTVKEIEELVDAVSDFCEKLMGNEPETKIVKNEDYTEENEDATEENDDDSDIIMRTEKKVYARYENIVVIYKNFPGNKYDYISLAYSGKNETDYYEYDWTYGNVNGKLTFSGVEPGEYEVRAHLRYYNGSQEINKRYKFRVK